MASEHYFSITTDRRGAELMLAEIGIDMTRFETAPRLAAWAGVAPGNNESAGKQRSSTTRKVSTG